MSTAELRLAKKVMAAANIKEAKARAARVIASDRKSKRLRSERAPEVAGATKAERRAEHGAATADLRAALFARSGADCNACTGGHCEACRVDLGVSWEMHHLVSGGQRRSRQSLDNVLALCWECHRRAHRGDHATLRQMKEACIRLGLRDGLKAVDRRIDKATECAAALARENKR